MIELEYCNGGKHAQLLRNVSAWRIFVICKIIPVRVSSTAYVDPWAEFLAALPPYALPSSIIGQKQVFWPPLFQMSTDLNEIWDQLLHGMHLWVQFHRIGACMGVALDQTITTPVFCNTIKCAKTVLSAYYIACYIRRISALSVTNVWLSGSAVLKHSGSS